MKNSNFDPSSIWQGLKKLSQKNSKLSSFEFVELTTRDLGQVKGGGTYGSFCEWYFDVYDPNPSSQVMSKLMWYDANYDVTITVNNGTTQFMYH